MICYSTSHKNPTPKNCDKKFGNKPKIIQIISKDPQTGKKLNEFPTDWAWLFFSFVSEVGCSIEFTYFAEYPEAVKKTLN